MTRSLFANAMLLGGTVAVVYGCWLVTPCLAWMAGGGSACVVGLLVAKPKDGKQ